MPIPPVFIYGAALSGGDRVGSNAGELGKTLAELRRLGRVEKIDAARVQMLRSMAKALDVDPANAALWRQYREALKELTADDGDGSLEAELEELLA